MRLRNYLKNMKGEKLSINIIKKTLKVYFNETNRYPRLKQVIDELLDNKF